jgi:hypothetical protein
MFAIEEIKAAVHRAEAKHQKIAKFHFHVLKNADELDGVDPVGFCNEISVPETYASEFRKMIALARLMKEQAQGLCETLHSGRAPHFLGCPGVRPSFGLTWLH